MLSSPLPWEAEQMLRAELKREERLIWTGQPIASRAGRSGLPLVLFGIPWTLFSIFWIVMATGITSHAHFSQSSGSFDFMSIVFPLFGIPFVLIGVWMLTTPNRIKRNALKTVYALTDQRALILSPAWRNGVTVRSISPEDLVSLTRTQNTDGSGTLIFTRLSTTQRAAGPNGGAYIATVGFENITDVRDVEALIDRTFRAPDPHSDLL